MLTDGGNLSLAASCGGCGLLLFCSAEANVDADERHRASKTIAMACPAPSGQAFLISFLSDQQEAL